MMLQLNNLTVIDCRDESSASVCNTHCFRHRLRQLWRHYG